jgi:hypothetical protein
MNLILYIVIILIGIPLYIISAVLYLIPFIFRHKVLGFMNTKIEEDKENRVLKHRPGYKKWKLYLHPYFWMFTLTTGLTRNYSGHYWFMRKKKEKWFPWLVEPYARLELEANSFLDTAYPLRDKWYQQLQYFWICYRWQGLRNSHWAFMEWFFQEGKWREGTEREIFCKSPKPIPWWDIMPQAKWDAGGNESGKQLRWPIVSEIPIGDEWRCTHEGTKLITFTTHRGNKRFYFGHCKVYYFKKRFLVIQYMFGWNWWDGIPVFHFKHILKKN